jgi:hypothetical protein
MPTIFKNERIRLAFWAGRANAPTVDHLREQLEAERAQRKFDCAKCERQIAILVRDLARAKYELAKRDLLDALAATPSPSEKIH